MVSLALIDEARATPTLVFLVFVTETEAILSLAYRSYVNGGS